MSIVSVGIFRLLRDGTYMWSFATARMSLTGEARITMSAIKKMIEDCQGSTIAISRLDVNEPANSYLRAILAEEVYISTTQAKCGCAGGSSSATTVGANGKPVQLFQYKNYIYSVFPEIKPGTDLTDNTAVNANTYYRTLTISANADNLMFAFVDSLDGTSISVGARFSKWVYANQPPVTVYMREDVVVKRMHSGGYYYN
jgi:hypothetical protein